MTSGGARPRSGPAPDENAIRRLRPSDESTWVELDPAGYGGPVPEYPFAVSEFAHPAESLAAEEEMWRRLWAKPQAAMWTQLGQADQVAMYVRSYLEASAPGASASLRGLVRSQENELGVSMDGMAKLRWRLRADDLAARRAAPPANGKGGPKVSSAKARRMKAVGDG
jgi:hypothetical protein